MPEKSKFLTNSILQRAKLVTQFKRLFRKNREKPWEKKLKRVAEALEYLKYQTEINNN